MKKHVFVMCVGYDEAYGLKSIVSLRHSYDYLRNLEKILTSIEVLLGRTEPGHNLQMVQKY